ncbi:winged helix-turn-helix domain-containing protein [uncultured Methanobrevibacter sp.]|uniref:winged helix-turn-helix domain-containing protein n=1 Tax=uncultured Methanobrevibacter sp. TaxID=253161 RepID=UPI002622E6BD|nr:winged helix-turn-helix domain-containing protein [uncultured Methanobrevibacter sp.]
MSQKDDMSIISLLARSKRRINVLKSLEKENKIPSKISKDIDDNSNHVSKYLKTLKDAELVECLNEDDKRYRFYSITEKGKYYLDKVEKEYND